VRVAVITDIHANLPALQATLAAIDGIGVDAVYCGGDLVGYGPHPNEVCALIEDRGVPTISGNYDEAIGRDRDDCGCAYITPHDRELGQRSVEWTLAHSSAASKAFLRALPFDLRFAMGMRRVRLVHGSPRKVNEYLFEDKPDRLYEKFAAAEDADALVFGHTHKPWIREHGGVLLPRLPLGPDDQEIEDQADRDDLEEEDRETRRAAALRRHQGKEEESTGHDPFREW